MTKYFVQSQENKKLPKDIQDQLDALVADVYKYLVAHKITIDNTHEVVYLAGYNVQGTVVYIDRRLPRYLTLKDGRKIDLYKYLIIHEVGEKILEDHLGYKYPYAHEYVTGNLERRAVENDKIDWEEYQDFMLKEVQQLKTFSESPSDLDTKPEKDTHDYYRFHKIEKMKKKSKKKVVSFISRLLEKYTVKGY